MAESGSPWFVWGLGILVLLLLAALIAVIAVCRDSLKKKVKHVMHGESPFDSDDVTEEEIISMVKEGHEQGVLQESEAEMIHNIFEFDEKEAKDIMTHRKNLEVLDGNLSYTDAVAQMMESRKSRFPVFGEDVDDIIGVLHIKDAFGFSQSNEIFRTSIKDIPGLIREVEVIPETMKINELFKVMQSEKNHMVVVVDEYGQTAGIVAMEDILEEIVGNIQDEHDEEEETVHQKSDGSYLVDGLTPLDELAELLHITLAEDSFDTLNGLLISLIGKIPADGETATICAYGYEFSILKVEDKIMKEVAIRKIPSQDETGTEEKEV